MGRRRAPENGKLGQNVQKRSDGKLELRFMVAATHRDRARSLNLNLGADVIAAAKSARERKGIGFARYIRDRIKRHLDRALTPLGVDTPEFFFWVEADKLADAHLHGAIILPTEASQRRVYRAIRKALKAAGGNWHVEHENQLRLRRLWGPQGWQRYFTKWQHLTRLRIQDNNTVAATTGLRAAGRRWYEDARATERELPSGR